MLPFHPLALLVALLVAVGLLGPGAPDALPPTPSGEGQHTPAGAGRTATEALAELTLPQRVGQLFMVGTPAVQADPQTRSQITRFHVGSVMLTGRSYDGVSTPARVARTMRSQVSRTSTGGVGLFVATDQEGGQVRVLQGPGFSDIPSALVQGTWEPRRLRRAARAWGGELRQAGVDVDLAPVADTVPSAAAAAQNPPIGAFDREFGYTTRRVARHAVAFARGMADAGVAATAKHFPGLGRVRANTDTTRGVTDTVTRRDDPYLRPFAAAVRAGVPLVMMSTAYYTRLDREHPAAFSSYVIRTVLRGDLGFDGVVVSDDLGIAEQVAGFSPAARALRFLRAGGDLVLTVTPTVLPQMYDAVLRRARASDTFRARVDAAALRVLRAKEPHGLLH